MQIGLHRLNRPDVEWIEKAIGEDVERGQLTKGASLWGFPAFPTKEQPAHKAIKRSRRMVVDYRGLNKVTLRRYFIIPNADALKSTVAGSKYISVGDLKEGFNQVDNEPETAQKMAVLAASGSYLPRGLTFGPTNGPEDLKGGGLYDLWEEIIHRMVLVLGRLDYRHGKTEELAARAFRRCGRDRVELDFFRNGEHGVRS